MRKLLCFIVTMCLLSNSMTWAVDDGFVVVGYLPDYRIAGITDSQVNGVTHLVYLSLKPPVDGQVSENPVPATTLAKLHEL